ncbi:hypothetical protein HN011_009129 [Eciton burchellii]|nr:hypothetical protein HN011_009129 [Eciton burchellii]
MEGTMIKLFLVTLFCTAVIAQRSAAEIAADTFKEAVTLASDMASQISRGNMWQGSQPLSGSMNPPSPPMRPPPPPMGPPPPKPS